MAYFNSLVLFCLACFANDVVELEPVKALSFNCGVYNTSQAGDLAQSKCQTSAYCYWQNPTCKDDPCLINSARALDNMGDTCSTLTANGVTCAARNLNTPSFLTADCSNPTVNTGILCGNNMDQVTPKVFDYCAYAYIRDQACPPSICEIRNDEAGCVPTNVVSGCQILSENDCKNVPKCLWNGSQKCVQDPCFVGSESVNCATYIPTSPPAGWTLGAGDCVDFKPLKTGTSNIANFCVHKDNKNPNICYFAPNANSNAAANASVDDHLITYPTYRAGAPPPTCSGTLTGCEGTGDCYTTLNSKGALAGLYCTDGTHGAASVLRIPSLLLFLAVCAFSMSIA